MSQKRYTYEEMITLGDIAVQEAKTELAQDISRDKKYSSNIVTHA